MSVGSGVGDSASNEDVDVITTSATWWTWSKRAGVGSDVSTRCGPAVGKV